MAMELSIEECKSRFLQGLIETSSQSTSLHLRGNARGWLVCNSTSHLLYKNMVIHILEAVDGKVSQGIERAVPRRSFPLK
jgi:hypothetical protein